jgi:hypothetical protein
MTRKIIQPRKRKNKSVNRIKRSGTFFIYICPKCKSEIKIISPQASIRCVCGTKMNRQPAGELK